MDQNKVIPVRVALRIRPLVRREIKEGCQDILETTLDTPQIVLRGTDKAFTFDYAFPSSASQQCVYDSAVSGVVKQLFKGYNVTILAYGQTGSGKTFSMGTAYTSDEDEADMGVIPRAVNDIFTEVEGSTNLEISVKVSFIELYKEVLYDLLNQSRRQDTVVDIREDPQGGIKIAGITEIPVVSLEETMKCLEYGAMNRATGATAMNSRSSRSHAIFSLHLEIKSQEESNNVICAKFHLVDLAGSERAKKTCATGERFKEGVNINMGLLALGNVISALCGEGNRGHIPYRDSKLTRLLQDSLGGNSHTVMIACVSPADSNLEETLTTLRYADRARKIKNKPIINRDPHAAELAKLRNDVQQLHLQLLAAQAGPGNSIVASSNDISDLLTQNYYLKEENEKLMRALQTALEENTHMAEKTLMAEAARDRLKTRLQELRAQTGNTFEALNKTLDVANNPHLEEQVNLVKELHHRIIDLQTEQQKSEKNIVEHELSLRQAQQHGDNTTTATTMGESTSNETINASPIKGEFGAAYTLRQAKLNEELQGLNRALAMKEELMNKMSVNGDQISAMKNHYEKSLKGLEDQINFLLKEKDELNQILRNASTKPTTNNISEQRRKRLQELEALITDLKKKITEQNRVLKMKEQAEQRVSKLNNEIQAMKAVRVKLIRQMKEDGEKFRKWKNQKDREVAKLKQADRQKEFQIVKMERLHSKQQNVLRRKMEEAVAINRRLKDAMALQKMCREKRATSRDIGSVSSKIKSWLEGELEVVTIKKQAKHSLETLIEDRKRMFDKLEKVKSRISDGELTPGLEEEYQRRKDSLEKDLQMRNAQISDIQSKIVDEDGESTNKKRFESVQNMVEGKCAMQYLFEVASENRTSLAIQKSDFDELNCQYEEACHNLEEVETELRSLKEEHQEELNKLSREHEDKILFLLRQIPSAVQEESSFAKSGSTLSSNLATEPDAALKERLKFQEAELARLSNLHELLQEKTQECENFKKKCKAYQNEVNKKVDHKFELPRLNVSPKPRPPVLSFATPVQTKQFKMNLALSSDEESSSNEDDSGDESDHDQKLDPDWKKTPLFRRIREITSGRARYSRKIPSPESSEDVSDNGSGSKRNSAGEIKCGCVKDCATKNCSCRKNTSACCTMCKCNALKCTNKKVPNSTFSSVNSSQGDTLLNSTFEMTTKPQPLVEVSQSKRIRLSERPGRTVPSDDENFDPVLSGTCRTWSK